MVLTEDEKEFSSESLELLWQKWKQNYCLNVIFYQKNELSCSFPQQSSQPKKGEEIASRKTIHHFQTNIFANRSLQSNIFQRNQKNRIIISEMIRKNRYGTTINCPLLLNKIESTSTDASESPRSPQPDLDCCFIAKEKLELCKKFIEFGHCPYKGKCKFAHGSHELRKNNQKNSLYKTKQCVVFFREGHCHYGDRCNFLHRRKEMLKDQQKRDIRNNFGEFMKEILEESRLISMLE